MVGSHVLDVSEEWVPVLSALLHVQLPDYGLSEQQIKNKLASL